MQEERYGTRDRHYSAWHRRLSTRRFIGIENAQLLAMIDLDASVYVEYDDQTKEPLALIETARYVGQSYKNATVTRNLARKADLPCFIVLYELSEHPNPADELWRDIERFHVKREWPAYEGGFYIFSPAAWAKFLLRLRRNEADKLDSVK